MFGNIKNFIRRIRILFLHSFGHNEINLDNFSKVLILAPHPDDETIGCAGLIQKMLQSGRNVVIIYMTGGERSHSGCCNIDGKIIIDARHDLTVKSAQILGVPQENLHYLNYKDGNISFDDGETEKLKSLLENLKPDIIFVPHHGEGWSDHIQTRNIVKKLTSDKASIALYEYCVWFWYYNVRGIDWKNACKLTMTREQHEKKLQAMDAYIRPLAPCGKPWSGVLPKVFIRANQWKKELYFKIN